MLKVWRTRTLLREDSNAGIFLWILHNFLEHLLWKTSANNCFWKAATDFLLTRFWSFTIYIKLKFLHFLSVNFFNAVFYGRRWVIRLRLVWDVVEMYWQDVVVTSSWDIVKTFQYDVVKTYHWDVLAAFHRNIVGCFIWSVPATSLGRAERRRYDVATMSCCQMGLFTTSQHEENLEKNIICECRPSKKMKNSEFWEYFTAISTESNL